jgi:hypothetical protein
VSGTAILTPEECSPGLDARKRERLRDLLHRSSRDFTAITYEHTWKTIPVFD